MNIEPLPKYIAQQKYENVYDSKELMLENIVLKINEIIKSLTVENSAQKEDKEI